MIRSAFETFESPFKYKIPHMPWLFPIDDFTLDDPWKSQYPPV